MTINNFNCFSAFRSMMIRATLQTCFGNSKWRPKLRISPSTSSLLDGNKIVNKNLNPEYGLSLWMFKVFWQDINGTGERMQTTQSGRFDENMRSFCGVRNTEEAQMTVSDKQITLMFIPLSTHNWLIVIG